LDLLFSTKEKTLTMENLKDLLKSIGVTLTMKQYITLSERAAKVTGSESSRIDFADFLRLMQWMLQNNFADINHTAENAASRVSRTSSGMIRRVSF